jgi:hypothetical protein
MQIDVEIGGRSLCVLSARGPRLSKNSTTRAGVFRGAVIGHLRKIVGTYVVNVQGAALRMANIKRFTPKINR